MLLNTYRIKIFNNECRHEAMTVQCFAYLDQDISASLPYLNAVLGGFDISIYFEFCRHELK